MHSINSRTLQYEKFGQPGPDAVMPDDTLSPERPLGSDAYESVVSVVGSALVASARESDRPLIVGVNGVDTAGKTEFAISLGNAITSSGCQNIVAHTDDFMNPKAIRHQSDDEIDNYFNNMIDLKAIREQLLVPASQGEPLDVSLDHPHPRDDKLRLVHTYSMEGTPSVLLVEGVFLFRDELRDLFDARIYLDLPFDKVMDRARARDHSWGGDAVLDTYRTKYIPTQQMYIAIAEPAMGAHVVVDMSDFDTPRITKFELPTIEIYM